MNLPAAVYAARWLVRDTFRQALASRTFWLVLGLSGLCIALCASCRLEGVTARTLPGDIELWGADNQPFTGQNDGRGTLTLGFGAVRLQQFRDGPGEVHFLQVLLAVWGGSVGMLLAVVWTAGFLPDFLRPAAASVLLAKPVPRWSLLVGKYLGVLAFVAFQAAVFVGGTWLALGVRTGVWTPGYLLAAPLLVLNVAVLYGFSALLAAYTRSTVVSLFGALVLWGACSTVNYDRHRAAADTARPAAGPLLEAGYWVLPKPADLFYLLGRVLDAKEHFAPLPELEAAERRQALDPLLSLLTSLLATAGLVGLAARRFVRTEY